MPAIDGNSSELFVADRLLPKPDAPTYFIVADLFEAFVGLNDQAFGALVVTVVVGKVELDVSRRFNRRERYSVDGDGEAAAVRGEQEATSHACCKALGFLDPTKRQIAQRDRRSTG